MPRIGYSEDFAGGEGDKYPRLKFQGKGEVKRIVCPDPPWMEWVHRIEGPKVVNGVAVMVMRKRKDNSEYPDYEMQWFSSPICLGANAVLIKDKLDPAACPACESASRATGLTEPVRRYAMPVVDYTIRQSADFAPVEPFSATLTIWSYTARMYDKLLGITRQWGNLREHDLLLGPCEDVNYQRFNVEVAAQALWLINPAWRQFVGSLWTAPGNLPTDEQLRAACGQSKSLPQIASDVRQAEQAYLMSRAAGSAPAQQPFGGAVPGMGQVAQGFGDLIGGAVPGQATGVQYAQHPMAAGQAFPVQPAMAQAAPQQAAPQQANPFGGQPVQAAQQPPVGQQWPAQPHPLEQQAAAASAAMAGSPFGQVPQGAMAAGQQAAAAPPPAAPPSDPFAPAPGAAPQQAYAPQAQPMQAPPPQQAPAPVADPFAAGGATGGPVPNQAAPGPQFGQYPAPGPGQGVQQPSLGGGAEFGPGTWNPGLPQQAAAPPQQMAPQQMAPQQPGAYGIPQAQPGQPQPTPGMIPGNQGYPQPGPQQAPGQQNGAGQQSFDELFRQGQA
jgi:hypothetical protein